MCTLGLNQVLKHPKAFEQHGKALLGSIMFCLSLGAGQGDFDSFHLEFFEVSVSLQGF